jgi:hypothetical protein
MRALRLLVVAGGEGQNAPAGTGVPVHTDSHDAFELEAAR